MAQLHFATNDIVYADIVHVKIDNSIVEIVIMVDTMTEISLDCESRAINTGSITQAILKCCKVSKFPFVRSLNTIPRTGR